MNKTFGVTAYDSVRRPANLQPIPPRGYFLKRKNKEREVTEHKKKIG